MPSLFFNADLVQTQIDGNGGAIAFVDAHTAWATGPMAQSNRGGIQAIIGKALDWRDTAAQQLKRGRWRSYISHRPNRLGTLHHQGRDGIPRDQVKVLEVIMDLRLHCKQNIAKAIELKRLTGVAPCTTRQPFTAIVAPMVDYAANVWMYGCNTVPSYAIH
ncbi:hypothetical protein FOMG_19882 [Fusarium oxysporum f. sp. melonis 26406]|uniref:Uncharacterized protein n=1 Tax=Fusarium oxysporum f. sp. melonis 26406 TaxID=1089452 RepID=W9Z3X3_FUSOX|nr:hypothetical protein FOMG_19882 [Fusarium oxysporum f. sp. melonis 26406]